MVPLVLKEVVPFIPVEFLSEGLILCVELFFHDQAPRMTCCFPVFFGVLLSHFFCAATGGYLLNLSDQLKRKFSIGRPFEGGF